jgi:alkylation response protein AidB-like acyl-CoA dehydrogenase
MMAPATATRWTLSDELVERCGQRAATYDRENQFFTEDFEELREAGYLLAAVPRELGGLGLTLAEICHEQRRLAARAPATAVALNMHTLATGVASDLYRRGDHALRWLLEDIARGEVVGYGYSEPGNDIAVMYSASAAERVEGGYRFTGRKFFSSLTPVWTRLFIYGMDRADPSAPKMVHALLTRETPGYRIVETWDTLGMRATRSDDTVLEGAFVPDEHVVRVIPPGFAGADDFVLTTFGWFCPLIASIYTGVARRAYDLAIAAVQGKTSVAELDRPMTYHPEIQHTVADMTVELEGMVAHADRIAAEWTNGVDHGMAWPMKLVAAQYHCVQSAFRVVDLALEVAGGAGMAKSNELERLFRDARCGRFHPANSALSHEIIGKSALGVLGAPGPRWG